jgi:hypothetical protein
MILFVWNGAKDCVVIAHSSSKITNAALKSFFKKIRTEQLHGRQAATRYSIGWNAAKRFAHGVGRDTAEAGSRRQRRHGFVSLLPVLNLAKRS